MTRQTGMTLGVALWALVAAPMSAVGQVRRHVVEEGLALTAGGAATGVALDLVALDRYGEFWLSVTAFEPDSNRSAAIDIPFSSLDCFLAASPEQFLTQQVTVPLDEDVTNIFVPALFGHSGEYFGLARRDWSDATRLAFLFRADATITAPVDEAGASVVLEALRKGHARLAEWQGIVTLPFDTLFGLPADNAGC